MPRREAHVEVDNPQEVLQLLGVVGAGLLLDGLYPVREGGDATTGHFVAQEVDGGLHKLTLLRKPHFFEAGKHFRQVTAVLLLPPFVVKMSSRYRNAKSKPSRVQSMRRWKVMPAFRIPNVILVNLNKLQGVVVAVLRMSAGCMGIWWCPFFRSI